MTIYDHLMERKADINDKVARNGLTSGLVIQKREVMKQLDNLSIEDGAKEYVPIVKKAYPPMHMDEAGNIHGY
jgi:hypothetical protein